MNWYFKVWRQYVDFNGRARRKEYWIFSMINTLIGIVFTVIQYASPALATTTTIVSALFSLAALLPELAVSVRRLHDIGKSGWLLLILYGSVILMFPIFMLVSLTMALGGRVELIFGGLALVPFGVFIWFFVMWCTDSQPGANKWGPNPKEANYELAQKRLNIL
jgi:uncharacterized membrane protein YhaH (DUF805 family)